MNPTAPQQEHPRSGRRDLDAGRNPTPYTLHYFFTLFTGPRRSLRLKLRDTIVYEPQIRARRGTTHPAPYTLPSTPQQPPPLSGHRDVDAGRNPKPTPYREREFFIDNLLVRIHFIIVMIMWTGLAPWECEFSFQPPYCSSTTDSSFQASRRGRRPDLTPCTLQGYLAHKKTHPPRTLP